MIQKMLLRLAILAGISAVPVYADIINVPGDQPTIQAGIDAAIDGDEVVVAPGTYNEVINFNGKAIILRSFDGPEVTIIDGTGLNNSVVKCVSGEGVATVLNGFTITGGTGSSTAIGVSGGGMLNNDGSSPTVEGCVFIGNIVLDSGGGMTNLQSSNPTVRNCAFIENVATNGSSAGMANAYSSNPTVTNCTFTENVAPNGSGGGMGNFVGSQPAVVNCTFEDNTVGAFGGGVFNEDNGSTTLINCLFIGNTALAGGGMGTSAVSTTVVVNCTFTANVAIGEGGGIWDRNSSQLTISNSVLWNNTDKGGADESAQIHLTNGSVVVNYSCIQGWPGDLGGVGNIGTDPLFLDQASDTFRLSPISPCIDAGDSATLTGFFDLDGTPRIVNDPSTADTGVALFGLTVDMGAFEYQPPTCTADIAGTGDGIVGADDLAILLGSWGQCN